MSDLIEWDKPEETLPAQWSSSLVVDVALGVDEDAICEAYNLQYPQLQAICEMPSFKNRLNEMRKQLEKEGASFKLKAQMQAEEYLKTAHEIVQSPVVDPKVRAKLIGDVVRWAGFDTKAGESVGPGGNIQINIDLSQADKPAGEVIEHGG